MVESIQSDNLLFALRKATESAARAAAKWIGRGNAHQVNEVAINAIRESFKHMPVQASISIGDGSDAGVARAAFLPGEILGCEGSALRFDVAVDPIEGTSYLTKGMTNAMAVMAMAPEGSLHQPGPSFYMDKFAGPPAVRGKIDPYAPIADKLAVVARETGKALSDLIVYVLEKPRHRALVHEVYSTGARVALYPAGDIAGAVMAAIPDSGIDALIGTGGTPEGIISTCAIRAIGGEFFGRPYPQLPSEHIAVKEAGISTSQWMARDTLVTSDEVFFAATGITTGLLFDGVEEIRGQERTESLLISGLTGERHILTTYHPPVTQLAREGADAEK